MKRVAKNIGWLLGGVTVVVAIAVGILSWRYSISPLYVTEALARQLALETVRVAVVSVGYGSANRTVTGADRMGLAVGNSAGTAGEVIRLIAQSLRGKKVSLTHYDNRPLVVSPHRFDYQSLSEPKLLQFKDALAGDDTLPAGADDFQRLLEIADWVNRQWKHGTSGDFDPSNFDAGAVLAQAKTGDTFWCHVSAMTLVQVAASQGFQGRLVGLSRDGYRTEHAVTEFWSNRYGKWVMVDPDFNIYYARNGIPQNVLEIHRALLRNYIGSLVVTKGRSRPILELESRVASLYSYYRYFRVDMRNDWLTHRYFPGHPARSDKASLFWVDPSLPPVLNFNRHVDDVSELYWDLNRVHLTVTPSKGGRGLVINIATVTPNFSHYEIVSDAARDILKHDSFIYLPHMGKNLLSVRAVNAAGQAGCWSILGFTVDDVATPSPATSRPGTKQR